MHSSTHFTVQLLYFTLVNFIIDDFHDYNYMRIDMNIYIEREMGLYTSEDILSHCQHYFTATIALTPITTLAPRYFGTILRCSDLIGSGLPLLHGCCAL